MLKRRELTQENKNYISIMDEDLNFCIDEGIKLEIQGNKSATACVFNDFTIVDYKDNTVGIFSSNRFENIQIDDYFKNDQESNPYLISAF